MVVIIAFQPRVCKLEGVLEDLARFGVLSQWAWLSEVEPFREITEAFSEMVQRDVFCIKTLT